MQQQIYRSVAECPSGYVGLVIAGPVDLEQSTAILRQSGIDVQLLVSQPGYGQMLVPADVGRSVANWFMSAAGVRVEMVASGGAPGRR